MMQRRTHLHQWKHQFDDTHPFEAFLCDSWQAVKHIKIEAGTVTLQFKDNHQMTLDKGLSVDLRIRSRRATSADCSDFLRPGVEICALSSQSSNDSNQSSANHVWLDGRINTIERKSHHSNSECSCQYYVNFYLEQGSLGTRTRTLNKDVQVVGIKEIAILQKLAQNSTEKNANPPRLEGNNIQKQPYPWESCEDCTTLLNTKLIMGKFLSDLAWLVVTSFLKKVSFCARSANNKIVYQILGRDGATSSSSNTCSHNILSVVNFEVGKNGALESYVSQIDVSDDTRRIIHVDGSSGENKVLLLRRSRRRNIQPERYDGGDNVSQMKAQQTELVDVPVYEEGDPLAPEIHHRVTRSKAKTKQDEQQTQLVIVPISEEGDHHNLNGRRVTRSMSKAKKNEVQLTQLANVPIFEEGDSLAPQYHHHNVKVTTTSKARAASSKKHKPRKKMSCDTEDDADFVPGRIAINSNSRVGKKKQSSRYSRRKRYGHDGEQANKARRSNAATNKKMIDTYWKEDMNRKPSQEEEPMKEQLKETSNMGQKKDKEVPEREEEEEEEEPMSEMDMLWAEMDMAMIARDLEDSEDPNGTNLAETTKEPEHSCPHDYRYDEQIGTYCYRCGDVKTEIQYVTAPLRQERRSRRKKKHMYGEEAESKSDEEYEFNTFRPQVSSNELASMEQDSVWEQIPELREKMHEHQRKAFEFLWRNIGGSMNPSLLESESEGIGGCVISHAPGAGKTFLIIAFLSSYLKLFPGKKPLVLAPKTTLHTWYKEFLKWEFSVPVYLIHGRESRTVLDQNSIVLHGVPNPSEDVRHVLDCLGKIKKWQDNPSVLVMSYTKFLTLMREGSEFDHMKYMAKALRESPGILILDEGHNPRNTNSKLRKGLMKVETDLRILLSGTLFQNNFCEYFNTLCLARPKFIYEVLNKLDPNRRRKGKEVEKAQNLLESEARKLFLDKIAKKINSTVGNHRIQGLNMLRDITNGFIDVYEAGNFDNVPGLQIYTLLMNTSNLQREILEKLGTRMAESKGYRLELELLITLGSIHPWLVQTAPCAKRFVTQEELDQLQKCKYEPKMGSKVRFILSLVYRVMESEKVLVFCHNLAPIKLLIEMFENVFKWESDKEILSLYGEQELFERGKVIDKFEDPRGASKVLLASITACSEGISLTAASRVVLLDSEWNPSKTKQAIARAFRPGQQKMVYVYQLLAAGTLEEDKYRRTTWKEWVSNMIFSEAFAQNPLHSQSEQIEDEVLRKMVEKDNSKTIHTILKNEKASTN